MVEHLWMAVKTFTFIFLFLTLITTISVALLAIIDRYLKPPEK